MINCKGLLRLFAVACVAVSLPCAVSAQNQQPVSDIPYSPGGCDYADMHQLLPPLTSAPSKNRQNYQPAQANVDQINMQNIDMNSLGNFGGLVDPQMMQQAMGMAQNVLRDPQIAPIVNNIQSMMLGEGDLNNSGAMMQQIMSSVQKLLGSSNMNSGNAGAMLNGSNMNLGNIGSMLNGSNMNLGNIGSLLNGSGLNLGNLGSLLGGSNMNTGNVGSMLKGAGINPGDLGAIQNAIHDFPELEDLLK